MRERLRGAGKPRYERDGELSGDELNFLALWFDANMNGVSEVGEVIPLGELGVTRVFFNPNQVGATRIVYNPDKNDSVPHDIIASRGFEQTVNGNKVIGASLDWFSPGFDSQSEALSALQKAGSTALAPNISFTRPRKGEAVGLSGAWLWKLDGDERRLAPKGALTFESDSTGHFIGHSLLSSPLRRNKSKATDLILSAVIQGETTLQRDGSQVATFDVTAPDGTVTKNVAKLAKNGRRMSGTSSVVVHATKNRAQLTTLTYTWTATKVSS